MATITNNSRNTISSAGINIQQLLGHAYSMYLFGFIVAMVFDLIFRFSFNNKVIPVIGFIITVFATMLMYWAQNVNKAPKDAVPMGRRDFFRGPYKYTRHPTHLSLALLLLGAGFIMNSVIITICAVVLYVIARFTYVAREEKKLEQKYGDLYINYKKRVQPFI
jgi:protein-S-isoprenylcysteine O-methyltransferase Ste14